MSNQTDLELEIAGMLQRARRMSAVRNPDGLALLIEELLDCAMRAKAVGFVYSARQLTHWAAAIEPNVKRGWRVKMAPSVEVSSKD